jgi:hypothetical protein
MTTFTITCPPTVAGTTFASTRFFSESESAVEETDGSFATYSFTEAQTFIRLTDSQSNIIVTQQGSQANTAFFPEDPGGGNQFFWTDLNITDGELKETQSWDGARTLVANTSIGRTFNDGEAQVNDDELNTTIIWTSEATTSSQTTTTQTATVYQTSFTDTTNVTTRTGTLVQTGTMTAPEPRTTATQTQGFTTRTAALSTTRVTTTTQQDTFSQWQSPEGGGTHRGTFQSATVVVLETSNLGIIRPEIAWVVTNRPNFTLTSSSVVEEQSLTQFTVFPSFQTTAGHVEQGTYLDDTVGFTFSTSSEEIETPTTYTTTVATGTTIFVASLFTSIPSPTNQQIGTTLTTQSWGSAIRETRYTGGDTSTTTFFSGTTHQGRIGTVTWNATHRRSTTAQTSFTFETAKTETFSTQFANVTQEFGIPLIDRENGYSVTETITFERPISIAAVIDAPFITQNQCGSSLSFAVAAASNVSEAAQSLAAGGVSVRSPRLVDAARTARAVLGTWRYVTGFGATATTVTASAGPTGLSATSASGPSSSIVTESTEGAWQLGGEAISRANLEFGQRINLGGTPPTGTATAFYNAGVFSTSDAEGRGTIEVTEARTESIDAGAARTAYVPATGVFISAAAERYSTTRRNITALIPEDAIITNRAQLVL